MVTLSVLPLRAFSTTRWVATFAKSAKVGYEAATFWAGPHYEPVGRMSDTSHAATRGAAREGEVARVHVI